MDAKPGLTNTDTHGLMSDILPGNCHYRVRLRFECALMFKDRPDRTPADLWRRAICHFAFGYYHHPEVR
jgi:hypothetical protein